MKKHAFCINLISLKYIYMLKNIDYYTKKKNKETPPKYPYILICIYNPIL